MSTTFCGRKMTLARKSFYSSNLIVVQKTREMQEIRTLVVDDFEAWRDFVRSTLEKVPGLLIVGEASDGSEAVRKAQALQPDLVVLDIALPIMNGFEVAREIGRSCRTSGREFPVSSQSRSPS
jgi:CheY-like chemotaxis protein